MMKQVWLLFLGLFAFLTVPVLSLTYLPQSPCPQVFRYAQDTYRHVVGVITVRNDFSPSLFLSVNASMPELVGNYGQDQNMKIQLLTPAVDLEGHTTPIVRYLLKFPVSEFTVSKFTPKITEIIFNGQVFCHGPPHTQTISGLPIRNIYATHRFLLSSPRNANGDDDDDTSNIENAEV